MKSLYALVLLCGLTACANTQGPGPILEHTQYGVSTQLTGCKYTNGVQYINCNYIIINKKDKSILFDLSVDSYRINGVEFSKSIYFDIPAEQINGKNKAFVIEIKTGEKYTVDARFNVASYTKGIYLT